MNPSTQIMLACFVAAVLMLVANNAGSSDGPKIVKAESSDDVLLRMRRLSRGAPPPKVADDPHGGSAAKRDTPQEKRRQLAGEGLQAAEQAQLQARGLQSSAAPDPLHPGVTTPAMCGEEPHSDPGGEAVAWGLTHKTASAAECCTACAKHAADPKNAKKPCNSWVFCYLPQCWSLDTGHQHTFGECWLKWQKNVATPLYGQRGKYTDAFRKKYWGLHLSGTMPDGKTPRN